MSEHGTRSNLWLLIAFEHLVLGIKFLLAYLVPPVPAEVILAKERKKFKVIELMVVINSGRLH